MSKLIMLNGLTGAVGVNPKRVTSVSPGHQEGTACIVIRDSDIPLTAYGDSRSIIKALNKAKQTPLLRLSDYEGTPLLVDLCDIVVVRAMDDGDSQVVVWGGESEICLTVREAVEDIAAAIAPHRDILEVTLDR